MKKITLLVVALFLILFEAIPEGLALGGHKTIAGVVEALYLTGITTVMFSFFMGFRYGYTLPSKEKIVYVVLGYVFLRFAVFDGIYNTCAGLPFFYIGTTKLIDQAWQWFFALTKFPEEAWLGIWKLILGLLGVTFLVKK